MDRLSRMYCTIVSVITDFIFEHIALAHKTATLLYVKQYNIIIYLEEVQFLFDTVIFTLVHNDNAWVRLCVYVIRDRP
jgi:hypothetical protein